MDAPKYKTLAELLGAIKAGNTFIQPLMIDNDVVSSYEVDPVTDPDWENAVSAFDMHPEELLEQALSLLGIPFEHV